MSRLCWNAMSLLDVDMPEGVLQRGEYCRLVMPRKYQYAWLEQMLGESSESGGGKQHFWLEDAASIHYGDNRMFDRKVACMLHQRGALANLTLGENILLPFLYLGRSDELRRMEERLPEVADWLELGGLLDEQAGDRSGYVHALIALGRALLLRSDFIVVQDVHAGMQPQRLECFRKLFAEALSRLGAGVLYMSSSVQDGMGLNFTRSIELLGAEDVL